MRCAETNVSAEETPARARARLPRTHVDGRGTRGAPATTSEGAQAADAGLAGGEARGGWPPRCDKLRREGEFQRVRAEGHSWPSSLLVVRAAPNQRDVARFGIVTTKRLGKAVRRNRVRRLIREAMRRLCSRIRPGWDLVIIARSPALTASLVQVENDLESILRRAQVLVCPPGETQASTGGLVFDE